MDILLKRYQENGNIQVGFEVYKRNLILFNCQIKPATLQSLGTVSGRGTS